MTNAEAHKLLDFAKEGQPVPDSVIWAALVQTDGVASMSAMLQNEADAFVEALREVGLV